MCRGTGLVPSTLREMTTHSIRIPFQIVSQTFDSHSDIAAQPDLWSLRLALFYLKLALRGLSMHGAVVTGAGVWRSSKCLLSAQWRHFSIIFVVHFDPLACMNLVWYQNVLYYYGVAAKPRGRFLLVGHFNLLHSLLQSVHPSAFLSFATNLRGVSA